MIRRNQKTAVKRKIALRKRQRVQRTKFLKRRRKIPKVNLVKCVNDVKLDAWTQSSSTSFQKYQQENIKSSQCTAGNSQGCEEEKVHRMAKPPGEAILEESDQDKEKDSSTYMSSPIEKETDNIEQLNECIRCQEYGSEIENLKSILVLVKTELENTRKEYSDLNNAFRIQNEENINLNKKLEESGEEIKKLTNHKIEEEIKVLFLESGILGEETDDEKSRMLFSKSSDKLVKSNKMFEESTKKLFQVSKKLAKFENQFLNLKRKSKDVIDLEPQAPREGSLNIKREVWVQSSFKPESSPQGLLIPKPKRLKLEKKDHVFSHIKEAVVSIEKDKEISLLKSHVSEMTSRLSTFNRCIQNYEELVSEKEVYVKNLNRDIESKNRELENYQQINKLLNEENNRLEEQILVLNENVSDNGGVIANLHLKIENYVSKSFEMQSSADKMKISICSLKKESEAKSKEILLLNEKENMFQSEQSDIFKEELTKVREELVKSCNALGESQESDKKNVIQILQLKEKENRFSAEILKRKEDNDILHKELIKAKEELVKTCNELGKRQEVEGSNVEQIKQISQDLERKKTEVMKLHKEVFNIKEDYVKTCDELRRKQEAEENYVKEIIQMKQELALNEKSLDLTKDVIKLREEQLKKQQEYIEEYIESVFFKNMNKEKM